MRDLKNNLELYIEKILNAPLWIKQAVYLRLSDDVKNCALNVFANLIPTLTFQGRSELKDKRCGFDSNIYKFLELSEKGFSILEISVNTFFSLEETAKIFEFCIEQGFIDVPQKDIYAFSCFISGKYRIGEYLKEVGIISGEQLEKALQQSLGKKTGETLINLGYVKEEDIKPLFILEEESQKRFVPDYNTIPNISVSFCDEAKQYEKGIADLKAENEDLKKKMRQLLQLVKNSD